jgi:hypothetical protein
MRTSGPFHLALLLMRKMGVFQGRTLGCLIVIDLNSNGEQSVSILPQTGNPTYHTE